MEQPESFLHIVVQPNRVVSSGNVSPMAAIAAMEIVKHALIQQMREGTNAKILKPTISPALGLQPRQVDREP